MDRRLRELTEEVTSEARFKEASAAERARAAAQQRKRAQRRERKQRRRSRARRLALSVGLVVVLAVAGSLVWLGLSRSSAGRSAGAQPGLTAAATAPADPFAGTPAERWADGAAGIVIPSAAPAGSFTATQVMAAYETTKALLIAANLNEQTLLGGAPTAFADLLSKLQRGQFLAGLNTTGVNSGGYPLSTRKWVTSFAPGSAELIGNVIKVHGVMSARTATASGTTVLAVDVNYLFAYPVEPPGDPGDWMRIVDHQYGSMQFAQWDDPGGPLEPWDQTIIGNAGAKCGTDDGYLHPDYPSQRSVPGPRQSGPIIDPYSPPTTGAGAVCGRTSGT
jgi:hypothetical protein